MAGVHAADLGVGQVVLAVASPDVHLAYLALYKVHQPRRRGCGPRRGFPVQGRPGFRAADAVRIQPRIRLEAAHRPFRIPAKDTVYRPAGEAVGGKPGLAEGYVLIPALVPHIGGF